MKAEELRKVVVDALEDMKAVNIGILDVRGKSDVTDIMIIASGNSNRHVKSLAGNVVDKLKENGIRPLGVEGETTGDWVLVDAGDVVVHIMLPQVRDFYGLERLWSVDGDHEARAGSSD